jgi:hypothetical protein
MNSMRAYRTESRTESLVDDAAGGRVLNPRGLRRWHDSRRSLFIPGYGS